MTPDKLSSEGRFDSFDNGEVLYGKKKNHLPAMGWNSWNAFGSGNTEALTKVMADKFVELGLDKLGYKYIVLDDGCYKDSRATGKLSNDEVKFPSGFKALGDYIHEKNLKFGMYNDIGTNLCAGAEVGTCGHEAEDAASYLGWGVDFLKVDNCYYLWDNATFSNPENARYTFAPNIRAVKIDGKEYKIIKNPEDGEKLSCGIAYDKAETGESSFYVKNVKLAGSRAFVEEDYVSGIGTFDGTGPDATPRTLRSSEIVFEIESDSDKEVSLQVEYATGKRENVGSWLQVAVDEEVFYDDFVKETDEEKSFIWSCELQVKLKKGLNSLRLMNHRRQENTLNSYARLLKELNSQAPDNDIIYSACEWGKTHPQNWAYKVCDSWRVLNDITFRVGSDGDPGVGTWTGDYTTSVATQYSKAVIMDEFAGLDKGWNDPDMMMIGMNGLNMVQCRTHMTMWSMMNSPLMLGLDLRRVEKGDDIYNIISNKDIISLNQDALGIQAKRVYSSLAKNEPDKEYIRDINRVDILCKPLSDNRFALSFINVSEQDKTEKYSINVSDLKKYFGDRIKGSESYLVKNLWTGETYENTTGVFEVDGLKACDNVTIEVCMK
ncbi:glycoside hydrolase family 27 protein [Butyrivibrio sp. YAB3001]|uniref:glycoside hydrolase family 27 protein n=1 Tax=Butyrivibrio sp. YAB3001 TaxID=1520812 RepID=UPI0008F6380A|nr:glycoside hydrolase family 27 protein [Butyrivibrio sp. YAB3001]SFC20160.1 alpha-galactosidase [Butyrivibrio sp. YAB3001]